jgi:hypothetical protein
MFLVDQPYLSDFLKHTLREYAIPVVNTPAARGMGLLPGTVLLSETEAIDRVRANPDLPLYTTSENAIGWIAEHLGFSGLPATINMFKNKVQFRQLIQPLHPDFFYQAVPAAQLGALEADRLPYPIVIKPAAGFFSMGVYRVAERSAWEPTLAALAADMRRHHGAHPAAVLDADTFIIEECIEGEEFAVDAYFNAAGKAVVLTILRHAFSSAADVGDRIYTTSKAIIDDNLAAFTALLGQLGALAGLRNFPVHLELRRRTDGALVPIEVNPMRFGGWCSTPDLTALAYGFNPYLYYLHQQKPDWDSLLTGKDGKLYSLVILDNATGVPPANIAAFDEHKLQARFEKPLEFRKLDHRKYPVFGFLFTETRVENQAELDAILHSDLKEYILPATE